MEQKYDKKQQLKPSIEHRDIGEQDYYYKNRLIFTWSQSLENVILYINTPKHIQSNHLNITFQTNHLKICQVGMKPFMNEPLSYSINPKSSIWFMDRNHICISLTKQSYGQLWLRVINRQQSMNEQQELDINELMWKQSKTDNSYLINIEQHRTHNNCKLDDCKNMINIICVMNNYKSYMNGSVQAKKTSCIQKDVLKTEIRDKYSSVNLLNDFNHLLQCHSICDEYICHLLNQVIYKNNCMSGCKLNECMLMKRHHRDRHKISQKEQILKALYFDEEDIVGIVLQQLLDRIHCHYLHSFDIGYKLTVKDKEDIIYQEKKSDDQHQKIISSKILPRRKIYERIDGLTRMCAKQNKFNTLQEFSYGYRFYYWVKYKNCHQQKDPIDEFKLSTDLTDSNVSDWYIDSKYKNIKLELLQNDICIIGLKQYDILLTKAEIHKQSDKAKTMICERKQSILDWYEMSKGDSMSINHLIGMMAYCNFDMLQREFSKTYRKLNKNETHKQLKQRHKNYYFMGKYLRECVECFGMEVSSSSSSTLEDNYLFDLSKTEMPVYHGVNQQFLFTSMYANIKVPFSTSLSYAVALSFCENRGFILDLNVHKSQWIIYNELAPYGILKNKFRIQCCDMQWISDYSNEEEIFCIGGTCPFIFNTIIDVQLNIDYEKYMIALKLLCFKALVVHDAIRDIADAQRFSKLDKQLMFRLISHQLWKSNPNHKYAHNFRGCPDYINTILDLHFAHVKDIVFSENGNKIIDGFIRNHNRWIDIDVLPMLFPNIRKIEYIAFEQDITYFIDKLRYESILLLIQSGKVKYLNRIIIRTQAKYRQNIEQYLKENYEQKFIRCGWVIEAGKDMEYEGYFRDEQGTRRHEVMIRVRMK